MYRGKLHRITQLHLVLLFGISINIYEPDFLGIYLTSPVRLPYENIDKKIPQVNIGTNVSEGG